MTTLGKPSFDWGDELPRLPGPRLALRGLTRTDAPEILEIFGDAEVMRFWSSPPLVDLSAAVDLIDSIERLFESRQLFQWGVCSPQAGNVIGTCTLYHLDRPHRRAEIGFAFRRDAWGRGLATEAVRILIGFAFDALELHRLEADVDPGNERSLRLLERQGFMREGHLRERWHVQGRVEDAVFLGLLGREWVRAAEARPAAMEEPR